MDDKNHEYAVRLLKGTRVGARQWATFFVQASSEDEAISKALAARSESEKEFRYVPEFRSIQLADDA